MEIAHLHKTACAKISVNLILIHKLLILYLLESRHSQVSKTVSILKFGPPVAKIINFEFYLICINYANYIFSKQ